jgi:CheY-like chemotaxis protein
MSERIRRTVLLLVNDAQLEELLLSFLQGWQAAIVRSPAALRDRLARARYPLVIVTNFGLSPLQAVEAVPAERDFPVLFLTGYVDDDLARQCAAKRLPACRVPIDPPDLLRELRLALDDPYLGREHVERE